MTMMTNGCFDDDDHDHDDHDHSIIMMIIMMMLMFTAGWMEAGNCRDLLLDKLQQLQPVFPPQIHPCKYTLAIRIKYTPAFHAHIHFAFHTQIRPCHSYTNTLLPVVQKYTLAFHT